MWRRGSKPGWPLFAAFIFVGLILERLQIPAFSLLGRRLVLGITAPALEGSQDGFPDASDTGRAIGGELMSQNRPPGQFLAKDATQIVAFLIRNRGRFDNEAIRAKWSILDRISLPLAIYLREIEANSAWDDLEKELSDSRYEVPVSKKPGEPQSPRHRKILRLLSEWSQRSEELLFGDKLTEFEPKPTPIADHDDGPETSP